jgi:hypothetical protein
MVLRSHRLSRSSIGHLVRTLCLSASLAAVACSDSRPAPSPTAPSSAIPAAASSVALTVRVQARTTELPIPEARVRYGGVYYYADASGQATVSVIAGEETTIEVSADGYEPMGASAILESNERWTFYLFPTPRV